MSLQCPYLRTERDKSRPYNVPTCERNVMNHAPTMFRNMLLPATIKNAIELLIQFNGNTCEQTS